MLKVDDRGFKEMYGRADSTSVYAFTCEVLCPSISRCVSPSYGSCEFVLKSLAAMSQYFMS